MLEHLGLDASDVEPRVEISAQHEAEAAVFAEEIGLGGEIIALGIGAGEASRRWPIEYFKDLVDAVTIRRPKSRFVLVGGENDRELAHELTRDRRRLAVDATGLLSLGATASLLRDCLLFIGNDSGPLHLAAASGCPTIEISKHPQGGNPWSYSSPVRFGTRATRRCVLQPRPVGPECAGECSKPYAHCITRVTVGDVIHALDEILSPSPCLNPQ